LKTLSFQNPSKAFNKEPLDTRTLTNLRDVTKSKTGLLLTPKKLFQDSQKRKKSHHDDCGKSPRDSLGPKNLTDGERPRLEHPDQPYNKGLKEVQQLLILIV
jgi:hypothetical protein